MLQVLWSQLWRRFKARGFIFNRFKRRYYIDEFRAYVGVNYLIQGTSADIVKNRMVACHKYLESEQLKSRMLLQVHDEMIFEIHYSESDWLPFKLKEIMEERQIDTFLPVGIARGCLSWAQSEKWDDKKQIWKEDS